MKTLFLVRHARSSRAGPGQPDRERLLDDGGRRDASKVGRRLAGRGVKPGLLLSSPALRALATAQLLADELGCDRGQIVVDERLYASSPEGLLSVIRTFDDAVGCAMLFGHNPEFSELAHRLSPGIGEMSTCAVGEFRFDSTRWSDVGRVEPVQSTLEQP